MNPEEETKKVKLSDLLIESPDKFVQIMNAIYGTDWLSYIRWRDGDHVADVISERLNFYYESIGGKRMNPEIELLKESDPEMVAAWDRFHNKDKRKTYRCHRCGAEWRCEYGANKFGTSAEYNGDPDILCQCCGFPTAKEVVMRGTAQSIIK